MAAAELLDIIEQKGREVAASRATYKCRSGGHNLGLYGWQPVRRNASRGVGILKCHAKQEGVPKPERV